MERTNQKRVALKGRQYNGLFFITQYSHLRRPHKEIHLPMQSAVYSYSYICMVVDAPYVIPYPCIHPIIYTDTGKLKHFS